MLTQYLASQFEDEWRELAERARTVVYVKSLHQLRANLLKSYVDAEDVSSFEALWSDISNSHPMRNNPIDMVRRLTAVIGRESDPTERARLRRELSVADSLAASLRDVVEERSWGWFRVGAWAAWQHQHRRLSDEAWAAMSVRLAAPFFDGVAGHLQEMLGSTQRTRQLDLWDSDIVRDRTSLRVWTPRYEEIALLWATLLLLRETTPGSSISLPPESSADYLDKLEGQLKRLEPEKDVWESFTGSNLPARAGLVRAAISAAKAVQSQAEFERLAATRISQQRVTRCREIAWDAFVNWNPLRARLEELGALEIVDDDHAFDGELPHGLQPKREFTDDGRFGVEVIAQSIGRTAAARQQAKLYTALTYSGQELSSTGAIADTLGNELARMRADGYAPDVVLLPAGFYPDGLDDHPAFEWARTNPREMGRLTDVPIFSVGPVDAKFVVIADLGIALRLRERKRPNDSNQLFVDVKSIDRTRAKELLRDEATSDTPERSLEQELTELQALRVEVIAGLNDEVEPLGEHGAVRLLRTDASDELDRG